MSNKLTPTQHAILSHALAQTQGKVLWFPETLKGGARKKVLDGLLNHQLIGLAGEEYVMTPEGYASIGATPMTDATPAKTTGTRVARGNSKQAQVIAMLARPEGATIEQICAATGWQSHYADVLVMPTCVGNPACVAERVAMKSA